MTICCKAVKAKRISDPGALKSLEQAKQRIECATWIFPSENSNSETVKENLEAAIRGILSIKDVEVEDFTSRELKGN